MKVVEDFTAELLRLAGVNSLWAGAWTRPASLGGLVPYAWLYMGFAATIYELW